MVAPVLCECGCGQPAPIAKANRPERGQRKGEPVRFILGHSVRGKSVNLKHGQKRTGIESREYSVWKAMIQRCTNPNRVQWSYYGGRGITICDRWRHSFQNFFADMGPRPEGTSIDRIDPDGNYEPGNCRWATRQEQRANRRDSA